MTEVLLVEDDPAARQGLELGLRRLGYGVRPAGTGEAALDAIGEGAADVVVLDVMLPGLDGFEVCRRLRRSSGSYAGEAKRWPGSISMSVDTASMSARWVKACGKFPRCSP